MTHSCPFVVLHTLTLTATTTHTTNIPQSVVRKLISRTAHERQKFVATHHLYNNYFNIFYK